MTMDMRPRIFQKYGEIEDILSASGVLKVHTDVQRRRSGTPLRAFDVGVYNGDVRACLKDNEDHPIFSSRWADVQHVVVIVLDEIELAARIRDLFPAQQGFVIESITECPAKDVV